MSSDKSGKAPGVPQVAKRLTISMCSKGKVVASSDRAGKDRMAACV
jgi:hypothetical protein